MTLLFLEIERELLKDGDEACLAHLLTLMEGIAEDIVEDVRHGAAGGRQGTPARHQIPERQEERPGDRPVCCFSGHFEGHYSQPVSGFYMTRQLPTQFGQIFELDVIDSHLVQPSEI
jgi:hypothetical protein